MRALVQSGSLHAWLSFFTGCWRFPPAVPNSLAKRMVRLCPFDASAAAAVSQVFARGRLFETKVVCKAKKVGDGGGGVLLLSLVVQAVVGLFCLAVAL